MSWAFGLGPLANFWFFRLRQSQSLKSCIPIRRPKTKGPRPTPQLEIGNVLRVESRFDNLRKGSMSMPEKRGVQATEEIKAEWSTAYKIYLKAPGDRYDKKKDRTSRIDFVAQEMNLTRK